jgi:hypothetical protein
MPARLASWAPPDAQDTQSACGQPLTAPAWRMWVSDHSTYVVAVVTVGTRRAECVGVPSATRACATPAARASQPSFMAREGISFARSHRHLSVAGSGHLLGTPSNSLTSHQPGCGQRRLPPGHTAPSGHAEQSMPEPYGISRGQLRGAERASKRACHQRLSTLRQLPQPRTVQHSTAASQAGSHRGMCRCRCRHSATSCSTREHRPSVPALRARVRAGATDQAGVAFRRAGRGARNAHTHGRARRFAHVGGGVTHGGCVRRVIRGPASRGRGH